MSNSKMGAEEQKYYDKWSKMGDICDVLKIIIIVSGICTFLSVSTLWGALGTHITLIVFGCCAGVLATAIITRVICDKRGNTYWKIYTQLEDQRIEQEKREQEEREAREKREREEREAQEKREQEEREKREQEEREKRKQEEHKKREQEKREQQEKNERICANEGHIFVEQPYENKNFEYKPELFTCLPLDFCVTERCSRCGAERKKIIDGFDKNRKLDLSPKMECPILYNDKVVGRYELSLSLDKSYSMQAKKDIPSIEIKKGELFLVLNPLNRIYYNEQGLSLIPKKVKEQTDKIYDDDEMPGLVELKKYIAFVDDETHEILSSTEISIDTEGCSEYFGVFKIGMLRVPDKGTLKVFCVIKE